jgi:hypothetical protein
MRANPADSERDDTHLARWYSATRLSDAHYNALVAWREDGGGLNRNKVLGAFAGQTDLADHFIDHARKRHRVLLKRMTQINDSAAIATKSFVMDNNPDVREDYVQIGGSIAWAEYFSGSRANWRQGKIEVVYTEIDWRKPNTRKLIGAFESRLNGMLYRVDPVYADSNFNKLRIRVIQHAQRWSVMERVDVSVQVPATAP